MTVPVLEEISKVGKGTGQVHQGQVEYSERKQGCVASKNDQVSQ